MICESILTNLLWAERVVRGEHYTDKCTIALLFCLIFHNFRPGCWLCKVEPMYEAVCAAKLIWIQQFWREGYYTANLASINTSLSNMFEQWRYHFLLWCRCWHSLPLLPDRLELPSNCFLPFAYCMSSILNDLPSCQKLKCYCLQISFISREVDDPDEVWCFIN